MTQMHVLSKFTMAFFSAITDQKIRELLEESDEEIYDDDEALDPTYRPSIDDHEEEVAEEIESEFGEPQEIKIEAEVEEPQEMEIEAVEEPQHSTSRKKTEKKTKKHTLWKGNDNALLSFDTRHLPDDGPFDYTSLLQLVEQMWPSSLFTTIAEQTNIRYMMKTGQELRCSAGEIQKFLGLSIIMGTIKLPRIHMYWKQGFRIPIVADTMPRSRFFLLQNYMRANSSSDLSDDDKKKDLLWRVRPVLDSFRDSCLKIPRSTKLCVDEMMISFQGRMPARQYLLLKPHPFGMKVFVLADPNHVVLDFRPYIGSGTFDDLAEDIRCMGIGTSAVVSLTPSIQPCTMLYFDQYFTSEQLLVYLLQIKISGTGTVFKTRIPRNISFQDDKSMLKNSGRGAYETFERQDKKMTCTKWMDNKPVYVLSTAHSAVPLNSVSRWSKKEHKTVEVHRPDAIKQCNASMSRVDLVDRMVSIYRISARTCKWPVRVILHFLDCVLTNAWILYRDSARRTGTPSKDILDFMAFRLRVGECWADALWKLKKKKKQI